ncbi:MAG: hypothetical protein AB1651_13605 [Pseudomonadota bacterium]
MDDIVSRYKNRAARIGLRGTPCLRRFGGYATAATCVLCDPRPFALCLRGRMELA